MPPITNIDIRDDVVELVPADSTLFREFGDVPRVGKQVSALLIVIGTLVRLSALALPLVNELVPFGTKDGPLIIEEQESPWSRPGDVRREN